MSESYYSDELDSISSFHTSDYGAEYLDEFYPVFDNDGYYEDDEDGFESDYTDYADDLYGNEEYNDFEEDNDYWDLYDDHIHR